MLKATSHRAARPNCYIIAGSNTAGKTTFATEFLPVYAHCSNFINPDLSARARFCNLIPTPECSAPAVCDRTQKETKEDQISAVDCSLRANLFDRVRWLSSRAGRRRPRQGLHSPECLRDRDAKAKQK